MTSCALWRTAPSAATESRALALIDNIWSALNYCTVAAARSASRVSAPGTGCRHCCGLAASAIGCELKEHRQPSTASCNLRLYDERSGCVPRTGAMTLRPPLDKLGRR